MNYHRILGLDPTTANPREIRRAYKRLALRFHPDKPEGDAQHFNRISHAYAMLCSPILQTVSTHNDTFSDFDPFKLFRELFRDLDQRGVESEIVHDECRESPNLQFSLQVTPAELLRGARKLVALCRQRFCRLCHGMGIAKNGGKGGEGVGSGEEEEEEEDVNISCFQCHGTGVQIVMSKKRVWDLDLDSRTQTIDCSICHGEGVLIPLSMEKCPTCRGNRLTLEKALVSVYIPPGHDQGVSIVCEEEGNDSIRADTQRGDLIFHVECEYPPGWRRFEQHLIFQHDITLQDCISSDRFLFSLDLLTEETVCVEITQVITPVAMIENTSTAIFVLDNAGFPISHQTADQNARGKIFLLLAIHFPSKRCQQLLLDKDEPDDNDSWLDRSNIIQARPATKEEIDELK
jgi:DnaJ-class molecular chaperone